MSTQGYRLKEIRRALNLSQEEFGKKIGLTRGAIASVEADVNKFSQDVLCKLIQIYNVNTNYLLAGNGYPFISPQTLDVNGKILKEIENILYKYNISENK